MNQQNRHRAEIRPVAADRRPQWSVMIPTYHCAGYLAQTLESVLSQDPGPEVMQIEVVDDHSTEDNPEAVVRALAGSRVGFYRHPENRGHVHTFNLCLQRSRGQLVHILHGDDFVLPGFYGAHQVAFDEHPDLGAAFVRHHYVDDATGEATPSLQERDTKGVIADWLEKIASGQRLAPPAVVVRRSVYEHLGGFDDRISCAGEDWEMWVRIAAHYPVWFDPSVLAAYRVKRQGALTDGAARTGRLASDMRLATEIVEEYLPDHLPRARALDLTARARAMYARWSLEATEDMLADRMWIAAGRQAIESFRCHPRRSTIGQIARLVRRSISSSRSTVGSHE